MIISSGCMNKKKSTSDAANSARQKLGAIIWYPLMLFPTQGTFAWDLSTIMPPMFWAVDGLTKENMNRKRRDIVSHSGIASVQSLVIACSRARRLSHKKKIDIKISNHHEISKIPFRFDTFHFVSNRWMDLTTAPFSTPNARGTFSWDRRSASF